MEFQKDTVDVWRYNLDIDDDAFDSFKLILSTEELERFNKYLINPVNARRFIAGRGILRKILSLYTGTSPEKIRFRYSSNGKPDLVQQKIDERIYFSLSHTGNVSMCAVSLNRLIGIDIERIKDDIEYRDIAMRYFTRNEFDALIKLPEERQLISFYRCWTCKEAYVKAKGETMWEFMNKIEFEVDPEKAPAFIYSEFDPDEPSRWFITDINAGSQYVSALSIQGKFTKIRYLNF